MKFFKVLRELLIRLSIMHQLLQTRLSFEEKGSKFLLNGKVVCNTFALFLTLTRIKGQALKSTLAGGKR